MRTPTNSDKHFLIGLTGNIGTGKSLVRKMLEHLGALGIDADRLAQDALEKSSPACAQVISRFGKEIVNDQGEIDRKKLGSLVFADDQALKDLEAILHPLVSKAVKAMVRNSPLSVVVVEAIKLFESDLAGMCRSIWVVDAPAVEIYERLRKSRGLEREKVDLRLARQSSSEEKISKADVVIHNSGSAVETWKQVQSAWKSSIETFGSFENPCAQAGSFFDPFDLQILLPSEKNAGIIHEMLAAEPDSFLNRMLADHVGKDTSPISDKALFDDREKIFHCLCRYYFAAGKHSGLVVWDMEHFNCRLLGYQIKDPVQESELIKSFAAGLERFASLHLCRSISIPVKENAESILRDMGYDIGQSTGSDRDLYLKAGYNLLTKTLQGSANSFRERSG